MRARRVRFIDCVKGRGDPVVALQGGHKTRPYIYRAEPARHGFPDGAWEPDEIPLTPPSPARGEGFSEPPPLTGGARGRVVMS
jgi:hypothetical protein